KGDAQLELVADGGVDRLVAVAQHDGADRHRPVDILVSVDVPDAAAPRALDELGRDPAHILTRPFGQRLGSSWNQSGSARIHRIRTCDDRQRSRGRRARHLSPTYGDRVRAVNQNGACCAKICRNDASASITVRLLPIALLNTDAIETAATP